jgi:hypothetical protein
MVGVSLGGHCSPENHSYIFGFTEWEAFARFLEAVSYHCDGNLVSATL